MFRLPMKKTEPNVLSVRKNRTIYFSFSLFRFEEIGNIFAGRNADADARGDEVGNRGMEKDF